MTKFEEEFKALTSWDWVNVDLIQQILIKFGNWHSDEEFQTVEEIGGRFALANKNLIDANTKLAEEIARLKSQLQQQALPVVPECVGEWIDSDSLAELITRWYCHTDALPKNILEYLENFQDEKANDGYDWEQSNEAVVQLIIHSKVTGYQVEKPQLFYLRDELTGQFLAKDNQFKNGDRYFFWTGADPLTHSISTAWKLTFTQQEIDSMETGSYELVPVEDGE